MGNTCIPVADSFWYLAKLIQFVKFKNKIKFKKKNRTKQNSLDFFLFPLFLFLQYLLNLVFALPFFSKFRKYSNKCISFAKKNYLLIHFLLIIQYVKLFSHPLFLLILWFFLIKCLVYFHCFIYYTVFKVTLYIPVLTIHISHELWNVAKFHIHFLDALSFCIFLLHISTFWYMVKPIQYCKVKK